MKLNSKFFVGLALFISWAIIVAILVAGFVFYHENNLQNNQNNTQIQTKAISNDPNLILNMNELAKHNKANDCWLLINNKIYDLTTYLYNHPGGSGTITPYCGKDGTTAFATKDQGSPHSSYADSLLGNYYIGDLNQKISSNALQNKTSSIANSTTQNTRTNREHDYEDD